MDDIRQHILDQVKTAFWKVRLNGGLTLHQARACDDYKSDHEIEQAGRHDPEKHWISIDSEKLSRLADAVFFLDARGFLFYAPAYMILGLKQIDTNEGLETEAAIVGWSKFPDNLGYDASSKDKDMPAIRVTAQQKQAALAYINYIVEYRGAPGYCSEEDLKKARSFLQA
ncbi:MAG: DUF6714 family protein [Planctomycetota bacterium]